MTDSIALKQRLNSCAVCGSDKIKSWFTTDFGSIGRCSYCGQVLRADQPARSKQVRLHQSSNLHLTPYAILSESASEELFFYEHFLDQFERTGPSGLILDVGCGAGEFLALAKKRGFQVCGVEPIRELRQAAIEKSAGLRILEQPFEETQFMEGTFAAIVMWDVLEHFVDPRGILNYTYRLLKPGGLLGIATINHASLMYDIYHFLRGTVPFLASRFGQSLYNPFHTYYFTRKSLARLLNATGFQPVVHTLYEFPISRLGVNQVLKLFMRGLYLVQHIFGMKGEQYVLARRS